MPTYLVGPARPYTTIQAAINAIPSTLTGTGIHEVVVDAGLYSEQVTISKVGANTSNYISIRCASESYHYGNISSGVRVTSSSAFGTYECTGIEYLRVFGIVITSENTLGFNNAYACVRYGNQNIFDSCLLVKTGDGYGYGAATQTGGTATFVKCLAINNGSTARSDRSAGFTTAGVTSPANTNVNLICINCGSYGFLKSFEGSTHASSLATFINNWGYNNNATGFSDFSGNFHASCSNNASRDSTAPGSNSLTSRTLANLAFLNAGSSNFHISQNSSLFSAGSNQSASFTTDWDLESITDWSIGPDAQSRASSVVVADQPVLVRQWPTPIIRPSIQWIQDATGNWNGSDRGATQDIYETEVVFFDTQDNIDSLMQTLDENREGISLSNFAVPFFSPEVSHTGTISAAVVSLGPRRHLAWGAASRWVYELPVTFRAISPTLLGTSASLSTLKLQDGFEASASYEVGKAFTYGQTGVYADRRSDIGRFIGRFRQQTSQAQAILAYLLTTARASAVTFPSLGGVTYPWGVNRGTPANCKVKSFSIRRVNLVFWDLEIEFVESV